MVKKKNKKNKRKFKDIAIAASRNIWNALVNVNDNLANKEFQDKAKNTQRALNEFGTNLFGEIDTKQFNNNINNTQQSETVIKEVIIEKPAQTINKNINEIENITIEKTIIKARRFKAFNPDDDVYGNLKFPDI